MLSCRQFTRFPLCLSLDDAFHDILTPFRRQPRLSRARTYIYYRYLYIRTIREHTIKPRNPCDPESRCIGNTCRVYNIYIYVYDDDDVDHSHKRVLCLQRPPRRGGCK